MKRGIRAGEVVGFFLGAAVIVLFAPLVIVLGVLQPDEIADSYKKFC